MLFQYLEHVKMLRFFYLKLNLFPIMVLYYRVTNPREDIRWEGKKNIKVDKNRLMENGIQFDSRRVGMCDF